MQSVLFKTENIRSEMEFGLFQNEIAMEFAFSKPKNEMSASKGYVFWGLEDHSRNGFKLDWTQTVCTLVEFLGLFCRSIHSHIGKMDTLYLEIKQIPEVSRPVLDHFDDISDFFDSVPGKWRLWLDKTHSLGHMIQIWLTAGR